MFANDVDGGAGDDYAGDVDCGAYSNDDDFIWMMGLMALTMQILLVVVRTLVDEWNCGV